MNSRQRFITAAGGMVPDLVPVAPYNGNFGAACAGVPVSEYNTSGRRMAEAQIAAWNMVGQDVVVAQSDGYYLAEGFGCEINQPYNLTPNLVKPAVSTLNEIETLKIPNPYTDGRMPVYLEALNLLKDHFAGEVALRGPGTGPFSLASYLMGGTSEFLTQIGFCEADEDKDAEGKLLTLMDIASDGLIAFLKAALDAGSDTAMVGDSLASLSMISPGIYRKYVYPFEVKVFRELQPEVEKHGAVTILHICGDTRAILPLMAETGADVLEIDAKVPMDEAIELVGGKAALMGNLEPTAVLFQGSPESVLLASRECMEKGRALDGGFILGSGCEVVPGTAVENMQALVQAARDFSGK